ncbi:hypothetical protein SD81_016160 [Tolypothrix campylonemoides VB511288]|nr:hypothetical protein SD81_016160 [Tolypothrix campylonemoides VB511288]
MAELNEGWRDLLGAMAAHQVQFMVVGGVAVGIHGHVRYTKDLDLWFKGDEANAARLAAALRDFGVPALPDSLSEFCEPRGMPVLGVEPNAIELINFADGVEFDDCFPRRILFSLDGIEVPVIGLEDLRVNKRAVGRLQDLSDLQQLGFDISPEDAARAATKDNGSN